VFELDTTNDDFIQSLLDPSSVSDKPVSDNVQDPQGLTETQIRMQLQWKKKHDELFPKEKQLRAPSVQRQAKARIKADGTKHQPSTHLFKWSRVLNSRAQQLLNENRRHDFSGRDPQTHRISFDRAYRSLSREQLSSALYDYVESKQGHLIVDDISRRLTAGDNQYRLPQSKLERKCDEIAELALEVWQPTKLDKLREAGRKGGRISKRPKDFTTNDLAGINNLTKSEIAKLLGCSTATVGRLRAELARTK
jgi:hypothetical protein